ncbi:hypothetical protein RCOM_0593020 [Ricinus communis]|uniref:PH domain-containing protein n=1 Tax=Ricinus communis TaxID=3988 RepID=B9SLM5_RICCO|nr:hypothetical protein RCOM_0593020 [Ricinus communis]
METPMLFWFKDSTITRSSKPRGVIPVATCLTVKGAEDVVGKQYAFELSTRNDTMYFIADSEKEKEDWINSIGRSIVQHSRSVTDSEIVDYDDSVGITRESCSASTVTLSYIFFPIRKSTLTSNFKFHSYLYQIVSLNRGCAPFPFLAPCIRVYSLTSSPIFIRSSGVSIEHERLFPRMVNKHFCVFIRLQFQINDIYYLLGEYCSSEPVKGTWKRKLASPQSELLVVGNDNEDKKQVQEQHQWQYLVSAQDYSQLTDVDQSSAFRDEALQGFVVVKIKNFDCNGSLILRKESFLHRTTAS